jgi:hypothetical protein
MVLPPPSPDYGTLTMTMSTMNSSPKCGSADVAHSKLGSVPQSRIKRSVNGLSASLVPITSQGNRRRKVCAPAKRLSASFEKSSAGSEWNG